MKHKKSGVRSGYPDLNGVVRPRRHPCRQARFEALMRVPRLRSFALVGGLTGLMVLSLPVAAHAVDLGTAESFAVLAGSTVTNTGPSVINGNVGLSPGSEVVQGAAVVNGTVNINNGLANGAQRALTTAYNEAASRPTTLNVTGENVGGGRTLTRGVYTASSSMGLTGALTLDAEGDRDAEFVFQAGTTLTTGSAATVLLVNGAQACNVFWQVGSSATVGTGTQFIGTIMADQSVTVQNGATIQGRALASVGAVTLNNNVFTRPGCETGLVPSGSPSPTPTPSDGPSATPNPTPNPTSGPTAGPSSGPRPAQSASPNPSSGPRASTPAGGSDNNDDSTTDDNTTDDDSTDDLVTTTGSGSGTETTPVVPSGRPDTGVGSGSGGTSGTWLAVGLLAFGGAAAAGIYGYRPLRPARARRQ
jgi:hypothetical protein